MKRTLAFLLLAVMTVLTFWKVMFHREFTLLTGGDTVTAYFPWFDVAAYWLKRGVFLLWDPYVYAGKSFMGEPQPGLFYPVNWFFLLLPAAGGGMSLDGMQALFVLHYFLASLFFANAAANPAQGSQGEALEAIGAAIRDSIQAHRVSDVPVGMFLSAGLDSAMITALATEHGERPHTLTLAFAEYSGTKNHEAPMAERLAAKPGTGHATLMVRRADFEEDRGKLFAAMDQPTIDGVNTWFASKAAAERGYKVVLSGVGGDELFCGYPSFRQIPRAAAFGHVLAAVSPRWLSRSQ